MIPLSPSFIACARSSIELSLLSFQYFLSFLTRSCLSLIPEIRSLDERFIGAFDVRAGICDEKSR